MTVYSPVTFIRKTTFETVHRYFIHTHKQVDALTFTFLNQTKHKQTLQKIVLRNACVCFQYSDNNNNIECVDILHFFI